MTTLTNTDLSPLERLLNKPLKVLLMDIDNTLYPYPPAHQAGLKAAFNFLSEAAGLEMLSLAEIYEKARHQIQAALHGTAASHHRLLYFQRACELLAIPVLPYALQTSKQYWQAYFKHMVLFPDVRIFLEAHRQLPIVWVTDLIADIQHEKLIYLGLANHTAWLVTSEEAGCEKPNAKIFQLALDKVGALPQEACMIGDSWERDILGAHQVGISALWFQPEPLEIPPELPIPTFSSYKGLLYDH